MIKLIATDLDGTLMYTDHLTVTKRTVNALKAAHEKGVKIAITTGRPMALIGNVIEQVPFVDYVVYSNGACVFDRNADKIIYSNLIPNKQAAEIIKYFLDSKVFFEIYVDGKSHYQLGTEDLFDNTGFPAEFIDEVVKTMIGHNDLLEYLGDKGIEKITLYSVRDSDYEKYENKLLSMTLSVASSFKGNLEATAGTANKGEAIKGLCKELGITAEGCMCFGDAGNDKPMLEFARYSFAMENGTDDCKAAAKFIAKSNAQDGLAMAVEEYVLKEQ